MDSLMAMCLILFLIVSKCHEIENITDFLLPETNGTVSNVESLIDSSEPTVNIVFNDNNTPSNVLTDFDQSTAEPIYQSTRTNASNSFNQSTYKPGNQSVSSTDVSNQKKGIKYHELGNATIIIISATTIILVFLIIVAFIVFVLRSRNFRKQNAAELKDVQKQNKLEKYKFSGHLSSNRQKLSQREKSDRWKSARSTSVHHTDEFQPAREHSQREKSKHEPTQLKALQVSLKSAQDVRTERSIKEFDPIITPAYHLWSSEQNTKGQTAPSITYEKSPPESNSQKSSRINVSKAATKWSSNSFSSLNKSFTASA